MTNERIKIFFCEDDFSLGSMLREYLEAKGYETDLYGDGEEGIAHFGDKSYDLCLVDIMMPRKDGFSLVEEIREINQTIPIIFITARNQKEDVIQGFRIGADDYITKPFSIQELQARIEAVLRRTIQVKQEDTTPYYQLGNFFFDTQKQLLRIDGEEIRLTTKENELLALLCARANQTLERNYALKTIWVDDNYFNARSMDVYVTKLRKILKRDPRIEIKNVHGKGYRLNTPQEEIPEDQIKKL